MNIPIKTLEDLEFDKVLEKVSKYAKTERVEKVILKTHPLLPNKAINRLKATSEYLSSIQGNNRFPFGDYDDFADKIREIDVPNIQLNANFFLGVRAQALQIKELKDFTLKFNEYYPLFYSKFEAIQYYPEIEKSINRVFDKSGEIQDKASPELNLIRKDLKDVSKQLVQRFNGALRANSEYLDDIRESIIDGRRVLAVVAGSRKRVKGRYVGSSKTGSIAFIEPEAVLPVQREYDFLHEQEKNEIKKILRELTAQMAEYQPVLMEYQNMLFQMDLIAAQAKYAEDINACLPNINDDLELNLINAYHPLLYQKYKNTSQKIVPHSMCLDQETRLMVISGPNAGGKSITLKTVGLLQLMFQSGLLVPVHEKSNMCFFEKIFTDIGDNQSIENQLSTYSYRLKQMRSFLKQTNDQTLLLIDEFGTGSDPELGGALAEVFLEEFYQMGAYGVLTTHYTNIKVLVEDLPEATNASMLFNKKTLEPMFVLEVGQAGSSFTFEVAEKNKIPYSLLNRAKKKTEKNNVRLDKTIAKLQQEKFDIQKTKDQIQQLRNDAIAKDEELKQKTDKIQAKLVDFQDLYDREQKMLQIGKKISDMADSYLRQKSRKRLIGDFLKLIEMENSKKPQPKEHFSRKKSQNKLRNNLQKDLKENKQEIKETQETLKENRKKTAEKKAANLKKGDRVKIKGSSSVGTVEKIENETVTINYGQFLTKINIFEVDKI